MQNLKHLLIQIVQINKRYDKEALLSGENFNIFRILKLESSENRLHSAFLTELLNPKGTHGHQDIFLRLFLKHTLPVNVPIDYDTDSAQASQEESFGPIDEFGRIGGRVDICIKNSKNGLILIENKIYAADQLNQLIRYHQRAPKVLFYLTLDGKVADKIAAGNLKEGVDYFAISYRDNIIKWLEECRKESAVQPILRESITQYLNLIKYLTNQTVNKMKETNVAEVLIANEENLKSAFAIQRSIHQAKSLLIIKLKSQVEQLASDLHIKSVFGEDLSSRYSGFNFHSSLWKNTAIGFEFGKINMNDLIVGIYHDNISSDERIELHKLLREKLAGRSSATWSYYKYFEFKDWEFEENAWIAIENGDMIKAIRGIIEDLLEKTKDIQHLF